MACTSKPALLNKPVASMPTPPVAPIDTPFVEPVTPEVDPLTAETTAQEESEVASTIESFIKSAPEVPTEPITEPLPSKIDSSNTQTMTEAIDSLMAKPRHEPLLPTIEPTKVEVTPAPVPQIDMSVPTLITPSVPYIDGNVPIANKKIISPLNEEPIAPKTDINVLFAQEEAKNDNMNSAPIEQPVTDSTPESAKPFDPNNIAL